MLILFIPDNDKTKHIGLCSDKFIKKVLDGFYSGTVFGLTIVNTLEILNPK